MSKHRIYWAGMLAGCGFAYFGRGAIDKDLFWVFAGLASVTLSVIIEIFSRGIR